MLQTSSSGATWQLKRPDYPTRGTSILGGRGKFIGTIGGALVLTVLINVLTVENISEAGRMIIQGALILILLIAYASTEQ